MRPEYDAESYAAANIQEPKLPRNAYKWPESVGGTLEMAERMIGVSCKDPETGKEIQRAWAGWDHSLRGGSGAPVIYIRIHDLGFKELRALGERGFKPHKDGNFLWKHEGPWSVWDNFTDEVKNDEMTQNWVRDGYGTT